MKKNAGFSLIELSIGLLILGLIVAPLATLYRINQQQKVIDFHKGNFNFIKESVNNFVDKYDRYPLPASLTVVETDTAYGAEVTLPGTPPLCSAGIQAADGYCINAGGALMGAVPFKALGINESYAYDYWGRRILYAVTELQTVNYTPGDGEITINSKDVSGTPFEFTDRADMILVSHGFDGLGAYTRSGVLFDNCADPADAQDDENCDLDDVFHARSTGSGASGSGSASGVAGDEFFDDFTQVQIDVPGNLWVQNITSPDHALAEANFVGINTNDPQARLEVVGDISADAIKSDQICEGGGDCFNPRIIAGDEPSMDCATNPLPGIEPVMRIANGKVECASPVNNAGAPVVSSGDTGFSPVEVPASWPRIKCSGTDLITGIDSSGNVTCEPTS